MRTEPIDLLANLFRGFTVPLQTLLMGNNRLVRFINIGCNQGIDTGTGGNRVLADLIFVVGQRLAIGGGFHAGFAVLAVDREVVELAALAVQAINRCAQYTGTSDFQGYCCTGTLTDVSDLLIAFGKQNELLKFRLIVNP
ncbi:hypothetical protein D9M71_222380 [compost metagenome]